MLRDVAKQLGANLTSAILSVMEAEWTRRVAAKGRGLAAVLSGKPPSQVAASTLTASAHHQSAPRRRPHCAAWVVRDSLAGCIDSRATLAVLFRFSFLGRHSFHITT